MLGHTYSKQLFTINLKFKLNRHSVLHLATPPSFLSRTHTHWDGRMLAGPSNTCASGTGNHSPSLYREHCHESRVSRGLVNQNAKLHFDQGRPGYTKHKIPKRDRISPPSLLPHSLCPSSPQGQRQTSNSSPVFPVGHPPKSQTKPNLKVPSAFLTGSER